MVIRTNWFVVWYSQIHLEPQKMVLLMINLLPALWKARTKVFRFPGLSTSKPQNIQFQIKEINWTQQINSPASYRNSIITSALQTLKRRVCCKYFDIWSQMSDFTIQYQCVATAASVLDCTATSFVHADLSWRLQYSSEMWTFVIFWVHVRVNLSDTHTQVFVTCASSSALGQL